jgi:hypothetical protein
MKMLAPDDIRQRPLRLIIPPQPITPPRPALSPQPAKPVWVEAWLSMQSSDLLKRAPQAILEESTPSFMYRKTA